MGSTITISDKQTKDFASELAKKIIKNTNTPLIIALIGDLGAGKTTFTQGFAKKLGIKDRIISPTFVLIEWAEKIVDLLPKNTIKIAIEKLNGEQRKITVSFPA